VDDITLIPLNTHRRLLKLLEFRARVLQIDGGTNRAHLPDRTLFPRDSDIGKIL
jgi:hypothetical protein